MPTARYKGCSRKLPENNMRSVKRMRSSDSICTMTEQASCPSHQVQVPPPDLPSNFSAFTDLPVLSRPQPRDLFDSEFQSVEHSGILQASLRRSARKWIEDGVLVRYWTKPETGKNAKPVSSMSTDARTMKAKGPCRIRIEPHIFEVEIYVDERNKYKTQTTASVSTSAQTDEAPCVPSIGAESKCHLSSQEAGTKCIAASRSSSSFASSQTLKKSGPESCAVVTTAHLNPSIRPREEKVLISSTNSKPSSDPVITMLAERASTDLDLKLLMKEVATGRATQEQLRVFQRHIDELTHIIQTREQRKRQESELGRLQRHSPMTMPQHDGVSEHFSDEKSSVKVPSFQLMPSGSMRQTISSWTSAASPALPVVLQFTTPGSTEDRFLFPQYSILESLSKQHTLVSFIVTRTEKNGEGVLMFEREVWQPITLMIEVAYGREEILNHIKRWVKPASEVRKYMSDIMERAIRAPATFLPFRLPYRASLASNVAAPEV